MQVVLIMPEHNLVSAVYKNVYDPTIFPDENKIVFSGGKLEGIKNEYLLLEDHIEVYIGQKVDDSIRDYDQSHNYVKTDFEQFKEEVKETIEEVKEDIKDFFTDDKDGDGK